MKNFLRGFLPSCYCHDCSTCTHFAKYRFYTRFHNSCESCMTCLNCGHLWHATKWSEGRGSEYFRMSVWYYTRFFISGLLHYIAAKIGPADPKVTQ